MSKKTLNQANLEKLGAEALAALVMELVQGSAALKRRARMELAAAQGADEVAADIRKRLASLRRATSWVDWRKQKALVKDLNWLLAMIGGSVSPEDPDASFELLWSFLQLAPSIHARTDDSNGALGEVMGSAVEMIGALAPQISADPETLAERILDAVAGADFGEFDGIIPALSEALGQAGLAHLKAIATEWQAAPPERAELERYRGYGLSAPAETARRHRKLAGSIILADVADAQGDVDAYMARYTPEQLTYGTIAPDVARRLLEAGRAAEAERIVAAARAAEDGKGLQLFRHELDEVYEDCLETLGRTEELKAHLRESFAAGLNARCLRKYLKLLPDFDDIEAEEAALDLAEAHPHLGGALHFLVRWPAHDRAARLVVARAAELDGNAWDTCSAAADALEPKHPLAATLLRRAMIGDTLAGGKSKRYRHAARHLADCAAAAAAVGDFGAFPDHAAYVAGLRQDHGRKYGFWQLAEG
ncbi:DUF6880 family protein [Mangrovicoccus sp. HB161399]|uniref:DUF6880 family protein n=1 Tax=Mangrovicoccus sp. HB161399 TaxID=2720392 RepID=UPI001555E39E|nr:DUF6880 family protein [Mangrovicoccus sp. HB161399]